MSVLFPRHLLTPRERWRSTVITTYVCLSVRLSVCPSVWISPQQHARSLPN